MQPGFYYRLEQIPKLAGYNKIEGWSTINHNNMIPLLLQMNWIDIWTNL